MFLFTTPPQRHAAPTPVVDAIRYGADRTGTGFDYLVKTAQKESALDPTAKAKTSSAAGLFQFIEQTWLGLIKSDGEKHGLGQQSRAISERDGGGYGVDDPSLKRDILALRNDPKVAAVMAGVLTRKNGETLSAGLGRAPSGADLYIAHVLGASGAVELVRTARKAPTQSAAADFPEAAGANRAIFFDRSGRARGAGEVYAILAANHVAKAETTALTSFAASPTAAPAYARSDGPAMHGLFRTEGPRGPVSQAVAKLWTSGSRGRADAAAAKVAAYYPSSAAQAATGALLDAEPAVAAMPVVEAPRLVAAPLPPSRPTDFAARPRERASGRPLDLASFMKRRGIQ